MNLKNDVSYLFSGMNTNSAGQNSNSFGWLGDYASIKNGSYGKLMKAYYTEGADQKVSAIAKNAAEKNTGSRTAAEEKERKAELGKVESASDSLKKSADALLKKDKDNIFDDKEKDAVYSAVSNFVKNYNDTLKAAANSSDKNVLSRVNTMTGNTGIFAKQLSGIGITVGEDKTLSLDKEVFEKADRNKVKKLFQESGSFGYQTAAQSSLLKTAAENAVSATGLYSASGSNQYASGNLFNSFF